MGILRWQTHLDPVLGAGLILGLVVWLIILYRRQRRQHATKRAVILLVPKALIVLLIVFAYFDPVWSVMQRPGENKKFVVLVDISSSMEVEDKPDGSRAERASDLLKKLTQDLKSSHIDFDTLQFDREVRQTDGGQVRDAAKFKELPAEVRETDLGKCLVTMADKPDISDYKGVILLTDGGDELVQDVRLPEVPVYITGVGSDPATWNDIAIAEVEAPEIVEEQSDFEVTAEIMARCASNDFAARVGPAKLRIEEKNGEGWEVRDSQVIDLASFKAQVKFRLRSPSELGTKKYRVCVETIEQELSELNNSRNFSLEVRQNTLPVLLFAQEVGWDFSMIRRELARDPSIALTALFRMSEDQFIVQGSRQQGDQSLEAGFPSDKGLLELYKCIIVGSFPASQWQQGQLQALVQYVRQGGAVVFLGGDYSFAQGGYSGTLIEPLFPWQVSPARLSSGGQVGPDLKTGQFMVNVPLSAANHSIVSEMSKLIGQPPDKGFDPVRGFSLAAATIESINLCGPLRRGAISLLDASVGNVTVPVVALQRYGQGQTMAVATNTLWKWTRISEALKQAYGNFWRQAVRNLSQWDQGQRFLAVSWDRQSYRPGERGHATIRVAGRYDPGQLHLKATLKADDPGAAGQPVSIKAVLGRDNTFDAEMVFLKRAEYLFEAHAYLGENLLESYEKTLVVGPRLNEGAKLEVDHAFLDNLATRSGGAYFRESDFDKLAETLRSTILEHAVTLEIPLVQDKYIYPLIFLGILMLEWTIRRKMNLF